MEIRNSTKKQYRQNGYNRFMKKTIWTNIILLSAVGVVTVSFGIGLTKKTDISHDEVITYLSATGHQGEFQDIVSNERSPYGRWAPAYEWKKLLSIDKKFCFGLIGRDLARYDYHPPMFFWLLHIWAILVGIHVWTGPVFNFIITLLILFILYHFTKRLLGNSLEAAVVVLLWALNPIPVQTSLMARQYCLLTLWVFLLAQQVARYTESNNPTNFKELCILFLLTTLGILTHYHFAFILASCGLWLIIRLWYRSRSRLAWSLGAMAAGCLVFILLHPEFYLSFQLQNQGSQSFTWKGVPYRLTRIMMSFFYSAWRKTIWPSFPQLTTIAIVFTSAILLGFTGGILLCLKKTFRLRIKNYFARLDKPQLFIVYIFICLFILSSLLYLMCSSPKHAIGAYYESMIWPFAILSIYILIRAMRRKKMLFSAAIFLFLAFTMVNFCWYTYNMFTWQRNQRELKLAQAFMQADKIVLSTVKRGVLPNIVRQIPDDTKVFVARREYLKAHQQSWRHMLTRNSVVY